MAITKKKTENRETVDNIKVLRAREFDSAIAFDMCANGVTIYGCWYRTYKDKQTGEEKALISFPSTKGKDDKYYNHAYFYVTDENLKDIEEQIESLL